MRSLARDIKMARACRCATGLHRADCLAAERWRRQRALAFAQVAAVQPGKGRPCERRPTPCTSRSSPSKGRGKGNAPHAVVERRHTTITIQAPGRVLTNVSAALPSRRRNTVPASSIRRCMPRGEAVSCGICIWPISEQTEERFHSAVAMQIPGTVDIGPGLHPADDSDGNARGDREQ